MAFDAIEAPQEIEMPPRASEFAVGDRLQADLFLFADVALDFAAFDGGQFVGGNLAARSPCTRLLEGGGAEQATDMISTERRFWCVMDASLPSCLRSCSNFADK
jgi:hypothetical protein